MDIQGRCLVSARVSPGCGPAAGDECQGGQPDQSPEAGEGSCGTRRPSCAAAGEDGGRVGEDRVLAAATHLKSHSELWSN